VRCGEEAQEQRDAELKKARAAVDKKVSTLKAQIRREQRELKTDEADLAARKRDEVLGIGESAFNLLAGRRSSSALSKASRKRTMTQRAKADVEESIEAIEDLEQQLQALEADWEDRAAEIKDAWTDKLEQVEEFEVKPRRADVAVEFCGLAWSPIWRVTLEDGSQVDLPALE
jgi:phage host-nuclease inhibitor protein Gam